MTNRYWNHDNPFFPGSVVRADEANDKFDGIEVGFDLIEGITTSMANQIKTDLTAVFQPQIDQHRVDTTAALDALRNLSQTQMTQLQQAMAQLDTDTRNQLAMVLTFPDATGTLEVHGNPTDKVLYFNALGDADLLDLPSVSVPAQWAKVYLGRQNGPPTVDNAGQPLLPGAMYYDNNLNKLQVYRNGQWVNGFISGSGVVSIGTIAPPNPYTGDLWWDSNTADLMLWYDDGDSQEWVVINSDYNTLFGNQIKQVLSDGSVPMTAGLKLNQTGGFAPKDAISREYMEQILRTYAGPSTIIAPHITDGVNPNSAFPVLAGTTKTPPKYDYRIAGTMLFFGNYGRLHADYQAPLAGVQVQPGDYVISDGRNWNLCRGSGLAAGAPAVGGTGANVAVSATAPPSPRLGDMWFNTGSKLVNIWDGHAWESPTGTTLSGLPEADRPGQIIVSQGAGTASNWDAEDFDCGRY